MEDDPIQNKLSYKIKIPIIILTLITVCAMGTLFIKNCLFGKFIRKTIGQLSIFTKGWRQTQK